MHNEMAIIFAGVIASTIASGVTAGLATWQHRKNKHIDKGFELDIKWKENVDTKLEKNQKDIQDIRDTLNQNKAEDMARLRVTIIAELRRCLQQGYRTETDNEMIEPLLDIYFDEKHNGNGSVKQLTKAYHALELRIDQDLQ